MPQVAFHTGVEKIDHACRLLRKAYRQGARVAVTGEASQLAQLDRALWTFEPLAFVPHARLGRGATVPPRLSPTPIWLVDDAQASPTHDVLVNLGPGLAAGGERYARVIELVSADAQDAADGRRRWRAWEGLGVRPDHAVKGGP